MTTSKITIEFNGHEQANAFWLWLTEENAIEEFKKSKWAKIANMFNPEIELIDEDDKIIAITH